ncbi:uncharacterized protein LOC112491097 isoform X1 [Ziziphus jujuba]|uniref:Uncharacterized protein LOC112491097 isoform X1 n=1 Tax=Ziziphus jujuba TaxID=326968 RepID=A0ABM4AF86_ZIZJJ|nr:uncharacterized protein LOC112491097 isoform X1 [Ziziphus jujuba]
MDLYTKLKGGASWRKQMPKLAVLLGLSDKMPALYQIGLRYTGGACMLLMLSLKFGIIPTVMPIGVRDFDIDGGLWVKLRLIPTEPFVGAVSWAFIALPKIKFVLAPFRLFNLMGGFVNIRETVYQSRFG